jgi:hypothetical protein
MRGILTFGVFYDGNTYSDEPVHEWLGEIHAAAMYYFGGSKASGNDNITQAKL